MTVKIYVAQKVEGAGDPQEPLSRITDYEKAIENNGYDLDVSAWYVDRLKEMVHSGAERREKEEIAFECFRDVKECDVFILDMRGDGAPGGSLVELGIAVATHKPAYILEHNQTRHYTNQAMVAGYANLQGRYTNIVDMLEAINTKHLLEVVQNNTGRFLYDENAGAITIWTKDGNRGVTFRAVGGGPAMAPYLEVKEAIPEEDIPF